MENEKNPNNQPESNWIDEMLPPPEIGEEINPDEHAVYAAGLIRHEDAELERIIHETKAMEDPHEEEDFSDIPADIEEELSQELTSAEYLDEEENTAPQEDYPEEVLLDSPTEIFSTVDLTQAYSDELPLDEVPMEAPEAPEPPVRKRRPKMKKGYGLLGIPHILATVIWLAIILAIGVSLGRTLWVCAADVLALGRKSLFNLSPLPTVITSKPLPPS